MSESSARLNSRVVLSTRQVSCPLHGEAALLQLDQGVYYGLNTVGARMWELLQQGSSLAEVRDRICAEYEIDEAACERDLCELVDDLSAAGLVQLLPPQ